MKRLICTALFSIFASIAQAQTIPCYSANAGGYWGPGMDCTNDASAGASSLVFRNILTGSLTGQKGQTLYIARNSTGATGGAQDGSGHGAVTIENTIGVNNNQGEHTVAIRHYNYSNTGWNPALDIIASKRGSGPTFGIAIVAKEETGESNPTEGIEPLEISYEAFGTDLYNKRASAVIAAKCRPDPSIYCEHGYRFVTITEGAAHFKRGDVWLGNYMGALFDSKGANIDNFNAISLGLNQAVTWGANNEARMSSDGPSWSLSFLNQPKIQVNAGGVHLPGARQATAVEANAQYACGRNGEIFFSTVPCR